MQAAANEEVLAARQIPGPSTSRHHHALLQAQVRDKLKGGQSVATAQATGSLLKMNAIVHCRLQAIKIK